ncbi:MAG: inositol monophosphatase family protein [Actinomycetota bacterium]
MTSHDLLDLAVKSALEAGELLLDWFERPAEGVDTKSTPTDLVSNADRESETLLMSRISGARPDDGIVAEEGGREDSISGLRWIIDPLDGTVNFLFGIPQWGVSIAVEDSQGAVVGVVHNPNTEETFTGVRGEGAQRNGHPVSVSDATELSQALIGTGFAYDARVRAEQAEMVARVLPRVRDIRRMGSAALDFCAVACGRLDGFYERGLAHWDRAAGSLIVTEAGGRLGVLSGSGPEGTDYGFVCAGPGVFDSLHALLD